MIKVIRKKNPKDEKLLKNLEIKITKSDYGGIRYKIYYLNKFVGYADYEGGECINFVFISSEFERKGVATWLYDYIENDLGIKLKPSHCLFPDGRAFWKNRLGER